MFSTTLLNNEQVRYLVVAEGVLPFFALLLSVNFIDLRNAGSTIKSRPPSAAFGFIWLLIACLFFLTLLIASMNFDTTSLILYAVFSLVFFICCVMWVLVYKQNKKVAATWILMLTTLFACGTMVSGITGISSQDTYAPMTVGMLSVPAFIWCMFATVLNLYLIQI
jgi:tryptophan-rich sensory protein